MVWSGVYVGGKIGYGMVLRQSMVWFGGENQDMVWYDMQLSVLYGMGDGWYGMIVFDV